MRIQIFILFLLSSLSSIGQNTIGLPDIINYGKQVYKAGSQNWDIKQDENGLVYFCNNEGLLSYDGTFWKLYPLPNKTIVRSIEITADKKIYVGGQNELGYFYPDENGSLTYHSLVKLVPGHDRTFDDVWNICTFRGDIFFRTNNKIFRLRNNTIKVYPTNSEWRFLTVCNGQLIAEDHESGALIYENDSWVPIFRNSDLPYAAWITSIIPISNDRSLIITLKDGFYIYDKDNKLSRFETKDIDMISGFQAYKAITVNDDLIAIGTSMGGCFIMDHNGHVIQRLTDNEGLQNNNIRSLYQDRNKNLWFGLENGIDFVAFDNSIKHIYPEAHNIGSGYTSIVYKGYWYFGTSNGLFRTKISGSGDLSYMAANIEKVQNTSGEVWNLSIVNNQLLMAHHTGAYVIHENKAALLDNKSGFWTFLPLHSKGNADLMVAGNYRGVSFYNFRQQKFSQWGDYLQFESARFMVVENDHTIWVAHPYKGIYKVSIDNKGQTSVTHFIQSGGLSSINNNYIFKIKNRIVIASEKGLYEYDQQKDSFLVSTLFPPSVKTDNICYLKEDPDGNIWYVRQKEISVVDFSGQTPRSISFPELNGKLVNGFENIFPYNKNNIIIGSEKGFYHVNFEGYKRSKRSFDVHIRQVRTFSGKDSALYAGYGVYQPKSLPYKKNSLHIEFSSIFFSQQSNIEYSYLLKGFEKNWSPWSSKPEKEYTNLPPGGYEFIVKARTNLGNESAIESYKFEVSPPFYRTVPAYVLYAILILTGLYFFNRYQQQKFTRQKLQYEETQRQLKYMHQLELEKNEKEIIKLRNEKLESEIENKNFELANSAMHLVQKKEMMDKLRDDLNSMLKNIDNEEVFKKCKRLLKALGEDNKLDESWDNFEIHFDKVHTDFLVLMKQKYPNLTAGELKLCAYVRLNLSSKEIAKLLNISIRGVETTRYRMRKKLGLTKEDNLFEFLLQEQFEQGKGLQQVRS